MCQKHVIRKAGKVVPNYDLQVQKLGGGEGHGGMGILIRIDTGDIWLHGLRGVGISGR